MGILLSHSSSLESFDITEYPDAKPPLAIVLFCYSQIFFSENLPEDDRPLSPQFGCPRGRQQWEPIIKRLAQQGANLHVPVPRYDYETHEYYLFDVNAYGTPLDELFSYSETPDEAKTLGTEWLGMLAAEGHDVVAYLMEEMALHSKQHQMTFPTEKILDPRSHSTFRQLQYNFDETRPCVWWEWWIVPKSHTILLEREFIQIANFDSPWFFSNVQKITWPFCDPTWHYSMETSLMSQRDFDLEAARLADIRRYQYNLAMRRANRLLQKRQAKNKRSGSLQDSETTHFEDLRCPQVLGAWQE